jgi:lipid-A-disaccharide synthase-like uncharacterized protein
MFELTLLAAGTVDPASPLPQWVQTWLDVHRTWELWWLVFGFIAQAMFFCRWIIQWVSSEKKRESHVPELFWWLSLVGATMTLIYFIGRREPIGVLGQSVGWIVYTRNLHLIRSKQRIIIEGVPGDDESAPPPTSPSP